MSSACNEANLNELQALPDGWQVRESKSRPGKRFYFNVYTRERQWKNPSHGPEVKADNRRKRRNSESSLLSSTSSYLSTVNTLNSESKRSLPPLYPASEQSRNSKTKQNKAQIRRIPEPPLSPEPATSNERIAAWVKNSTKEQGLIPELNDHQIDTQAGVTGEGETAPVSRRTRQRKKGLSPLKAAPPFQIKDMVMTRSKLSSERQEPKEKRERKKDAEKQSVCSSRTTSEHSFSFRKAYSDLQKEKSGAQHLVVNTGNASQDASCSNLVNGHMQSSSSPSTPSSERISRISPPVANKNGITTPLPTGDKGKVPESMPDGSNVSTPFFGYDFKSSEPSTNKDEFTFGSTLSTSTPYFNSNARMPSKERERVLSMEANVSKGTTFSRDVEQQQCDAEIFSDEYSGDEDEGMDIDDAEELQEQILSVLQEVRAQHQLMTMDVGSQEEEAPALGYQDTLYIVLDTNVLLSHLKFIMELRDFPVSGLGCAPVLVIPWIVTKELDSLKSFSHKVQHLARNAVRFLSACFEENHPRIRGQTYAEAAVRIDGFEESNNDDSILLCSLLFSKQAERGHTILFSNDKNLCNKARIHGIKAFEKENLIKGLNDLFQTALVVKQGNFKEYYDQLAIQQNLAKKRAKADDIICELQCIMREGFAAIVETEMKVAYGEDLWEHIVYIKPPWTFRDLLQLLDKHWIAVFGQIVKRSLHDTLIQISKRFSDNKGPPSCLYHVQEVLDQVMSMMEAFSVKSNYDGVLPKCIAAVLVLQKKCSEAQVGSLPRELSEATQLISTEIKDQLTALTDLSTIPPAVRMQHQQPMTLNEGRQTAEITEENTGIPEDGEVRNVGNANQEVLSSFNTIWSAVTQFSYQIFNTLDYPHTIPPSVLPPNLQKPTRGEALQFLGKLCNHLSPLVAALQGVQMADKDPNSERFDTLAEATKVFLSEITQINSKLTAEQLYMFTVDPTTRESLVEGTSQLDRALGMLQHCANCLVRTNGEIFP